MRLCSPPRERSADTRSAARDPVSNDERTVKTLMKKVFYFAPHQDDELTNFGVSITREIDEGANVVVVLCTDGGASGVKRMLRDGGGCAWHERKHSFDLDGDAFTSARDREFVASCLALGVKKENILISPLRAPDGSLTPQRAKEIMLAATRGEKAADVAVRVLSDRPDLRQNPDHTATGRAAKELLAEGKIGEAIYFYELIHLFGRSPEELGLKTVYPDEDQKSRLIAAAAEYKRWDPDAGRYAVGYHSVADEFDEFLSDPRGFIV